MLNWDCKNIKIPRDKRLKGLPIPTPPQKNTLGRFCSFCCTELRLWNYVCKHPGPFNEMMPWSNLSPRDPAVTISTMNWLFSVNMHLKTKKNTSKQSLPEAAPACPAGSAASFSPSNLPSEQRHRHCLLSKQRLDAGWEVWSRLKMAEKLSKAPGKVASPTQRRHRPVQNTLKISPKARCHCSLRLRGQRDNITAIFYPRTSAREHNERINVVFFFLKKKQP